MVGNTGTENTHEVKGVLEAEVISEGTLLMRQNYQRGKWVYDNSMPSSGHQLWVWLPSIRVWMFL